MERCTEKLHGGRNSKLGDGLSARIPLDGLTELIGEHGAEQRRHIKGSENGQAVSEGEEEV